MANQNSRQDDQDNNSGTSTRGFASMDPDRVKEIASMGGRAAHASGNAHEFTSEEAREAGRIAHSRGNAHEFTSEEAREAGSLSHKNDRRSSSRDDDDYDDRGSRGNSNQKRDEYGRFTR
ncbi:KGG domain-containing protein [Acinetobacter proteolyticus]|uniref:KGG domain-containing protein n=1 Tax=Acinetobacter proteolyticus TaxID=1776741 RepID=UPI0031E1C3AA